MVTCEIRTKAHDRCKSKKNIKYKSQTPVSLYLFQTHVFVPLYFAVGNEQITLLLTKKKYSFY